MIHQGQSCEKSTGQSLVHSIRSGKASPGNKIQAKTSFLHLAVLGCMGLLIGASIASVGVSLVRARDDGGIYEAMRDNVPVRGYNPPALYANNHQSHSGPLSIFTSLGRGERQENSRTSGLQVAPSQNKGSDESKNAANVEQAPVAKPAVRKVKVSATSPDFKKSRSVCVRMCDGYHFPIGNLPASGEASAHENACKATCPDAPVKLFTLAPGKSDIEDATSGSMSYRNLPMAFAHQRETDKACRCHAGIAHSLRLSLLEDKTLREGDSIVLDGKVKVFEGSKNWPFLEKDFTEFKNSKSIRNADRKKINEKLGFSIRQKDRTRLSEVMPATLRGAPASQFKVIQVSANNGVRVIAPSIYQE